MIRITRTAESAAQCQWAIANYPELISLLGQYLPANMVNLFARPSAASDGVVEWYSELNGKPVPLAELSPGEAERLERVLEQKLAAIADLHAKLQPQGMLSAESLALLSVASGKPDRGSVWSVGGQPVITFWSANNVSAVPATIAARRLWWPWLLAFLFIAALALFLLRGCMTQTAVPEVVQPVAHITPVVPEKSIKKLCPAQRAELQAPEVVVIFDASGSMSLSMDATPEDLIRWSEQKPVTNIEREPRRITLARSSANQIIDSLPKDMNISLIAAETCNRVTTTSPFPAEQRAQLKASINRIEPVGKTALAEALTKAGKMVDGVNRDAIILLITDGDETCGGDPCAVAQALKQAKPRLQVNVVDIMNSGAGNCIASNTGGSVFAVNNTKEFSAMMNKALEEYIPENCE
ncbi:VWA domain-containing protein [Cedecea davisae]|uniref:VWA domain-containing protein n=1 Tax=Cedecea davisae TaxID=158484 RepID=A0ABS6DH06_9ENTR|nr:VWA domain-containing protein [Cedecea davisae]MBU4682360.1 VWA domain-containing protein [Cedecea davisae]MBU4688450.1 VWA domain-containing protein [Cedecea davisae]